MHNERTIVNPPASGALTCEDYLIKLFPLFNTALFTSINTAAASIGNAFMSHVAQKFAPSSQPETIKNAALSAVMGFMIISLACAFFSKPSTKKNPRDRLSETANIFYPLACTDMMLAFPLPIFTAYFIYNSSLFDATMIGISAGIGANMLLLPILFSAMLFQLGNHLKPTETASDDETFENRVRAIVHRELNPELTTDPLDHTVIQVRSEDPADSDRNPNVIEMHP